MADAQVQNPEALSKTDVEVMQYPQEGWEKIGFEDYKESTSKTRERALLDSYGIIPFLCRECRERYMTRKSGAK